MELSFVLVSSGQPSANPRLVKEAVALMESGALVTVVYTPISAWADPFDKALFQRYPKIRWISVGYHASNQPFQFKMASLRRKLYEWLFVRWSSSVFLAERSFSLFSQELIRQTMSLKADWFIGHNLGALAAVVLAAEKFNAKSSFDFEDYHRGEAAPNTLSTLQVTLIENKYVPRLAKATAAAPLIGKAYQAHFPELPISVINNCFPRSYAPREHRILNTSGLKLFWFSQFVGKKRGLETAIAAMGLLKNAKVTLTLLGTCSPEMKEYLLCLAAEHGLTTDQLIFLTPVAESEIATIAAKHHIGLAAEIPHIQNRELCLTNKIFLYLLAGNAILFSKTKSQVAFLAEHPNIGLLYPPDEAEALAKQIARYWQDFHLLERHRRKAFELGQRLCWDEEQKRFLSLFHLV